jgi:hypothetical protein
MNNVHEDKPVLFETRWALSYLRGPLTRAQLQMLKKDAGATFTAPSPEEKGAMNRAPTDAVSDRPVLAPEIPQYFLPVRSTEPAGANLIYVPQIWGSAKIYYADPKAGIATEQSLVFLTKASRVWDGAQSTDLDESDLEKFPAPDSVFGELPSEASNPKSYGVWTRAFSDWLFRTQKLDLLKSNLFGQISKPGESERDFRIRLQQASREERDRQVEKLRQKYSAKISSIQDRIRRAEQSVEREKAQASQQKMQTAISFGTTVLGALFGRKKLSTSVLGRATTAARGVGRSIKESEDIDRAEESVDVQRKQLSDLESQVQMETQDLTTRIDPQSESLQTVEVRPKKANITVKSVALAWVPHWQDASGKLIQAV